MHLGKVAGGGVFKRRVEKRVSEVSWRLCEWDQVWFINYVICELLRG